MAVCLLAVLLLIPIVQSCLKSMATEITSPDETFKVKIGELDGRIYYLVEFKNNTVIDTSYLSMNYAHNSIGERSHIVDANIIKVDSVFKDNNSGEIFHERYNELRLSLREGLAMPLFYNLIFRLYPDGVAFRYAIPDHIPYSSEKVIEENIQFNIVEDAVAWVVEPNEYNNGRKLRPVLLSNIDTVDVPITLKITDNLFLNINEITNSNSSKMRLTLINGNTVLSSYNKFPIQHTEISSLYPWRSVIIADNAAQFVISPQIKSLENSYKWLAHTENYNPSIKETDILYSLVPYTQTSLKELSDSLASSYCSDLIRLYSQWMINQRQIHKEYSKKLKFPYFFPTELIPDWDNGWEETMVPELKIGEYITIIKKEGNSQRWFLSSIAEDYPHNVVINLDFLDKDCKYKAQIFSDTRITEPDSLPYRISRKEMTVDSENQFVLHLSGNDGKMVTFTKVS